MDRPSILELSSDQLKQWLSDQGEPSYRARQIRAGVLGRGITQFDQLTDLPLSLRSLLEEAFVLRSTTITTHRRDSDGTEKLLLRLADGNDIECVLLREKDRRTLCMSTQVGCAMGCVFCASGLAGLTRNLKAGELIEQMLRTRELLGSEERLSHIVVMGMGEPLQNLDALLPALSVACSKEGLGLSARHITISTVGLPAKIDRLADHGKPYHLAVSLHAPNETLRQQIVPMARQIPFDQLVAASDRYRRQTGRQVTFEYVMLAGINDSLADAKQLSRLLRGRDAMVNLIPFNPVTGLPYRTPAAEQVNDFADHLRRSGVVVHVRKRKGSKIDAACGQLRRAKLQEQASLVQLTT